MGETKGVGIRVYILIIVSIFILVACDPSAAVVFTGDLIPIQVSINSQGEISVGVAPSISIPAVGSIELQAGTSIAAVKPKRQRQMLIVRVDDQVHFYALEEGKAFEVTFVGDEQHYRKVRLSKDADDDFVLELESVPSVANGTGSQSPSTGEDDAPPGNALLRDAPEEPEVARDDIEALLARWDELHYRANRYYETDDLDTVSYGGVLTRQHSIVATLKSDSCFWERRDIVTPRIARFDIRSDRRVVVDVQKNWDMDLMCKEGKRQDNDGPFTMRYTVELIDGRWLVTGREQIE